jgi:hypothetical protein
MPDPQIVYLLWHGDDIDGDTPEAKLLGVYSSEQAALDRIQHSAEEPGFVDHPDDFRIVPYTIDRDEWEDGYIEVG